MPHTIFQKSSLASPPLRPPMAYPGVSLLIISAAHFFLSSASNPPWTIANIFCSFGRSWAEMHRSNHLGNEFKGYNFNFIDSDRDGDGN